MRHATRKRAWLRRHACSLATFRMVLSGLRQPDPWMAAIFASAMRNGAVCHDPGPWA